MSHRALKNTVVFTDLGPGQTVVLPHGLGIPGPYEGVPIGPDVIFLPSPDLSVEASSTTLTLTNNGSVTLSGAVLVEYWHSIERVFPSHSSTSLPVKPYIVVSVEGGNEPPIPPFALTEITIWANQTGDDATGKGTEEEPYLTFQRAVRDIPAFIPPGTRYTINITNLGDEELPEGFELPSWTASDFIFPPNAVSIVADMKPAEGLAPSAHTFTPTGKTWNPIAKVWTIEDSAQAWPDLKRKYLVWADGELAGVIHENTGTELQITGDEFPFGEMQIMEPSARLIGNWQIGCAASILMFGVALIEAEPFNGTVTVANTQMWMERCTVEGGYFASPMYRHYTFNCDLVRPAWAGLFYCSGCLVTDFEFEAFEASLYMIFKSGTVFENIGTIMPVNLDPAWRFGTNLLLVGVLIKNALGDGVYLPGGVAVIQDVEINNCDGDALRFKGPGKYTLSNVGGGGSAGVGVRADDGAVIECTTLTGTGSKLEVIPDEDFGTVTVLTSVGAGFDKYPRSAITIAGSANPANNGSFQVIYAEEDFIVFINQDGVAEDPYLGTWVVDPVSISGADDQQVGDLAAGAWPAVPFNVVDVFGGANPNTTGTGSRIYNK